MLNSMQSKGQFSSCWWGNKNCYRYPCILLNNQGSFGHTHTHTPTRTFYLEQTSENNLSHTEIQFLENNFLHMRRGAVISVIFSVEWLKHLPWRTPCLAVFTSFIFCSHSRVETRIFLLCSLPLCVVVIHNATDLSFLFPGRLSSCI